MSTQPSPGQSQLPPRARQRLAEDERRAQIVRAAIAVVARLGFTGASTTLIAAEAGVSKGLLWHYFRNKDDLLKQAVVATLTSIQEELIAEIDVTAPPPEIIRAAIRWIAAWSIGHRREIRAMDQITRVLRAEDGEPAFSLADYDPLYESQEQLFRRGQAEGWFRPFDVRVMAVTYQGAIDMMLSYADSHPDTDVEQYAESLIDIILAAVRA